MLTAEARRRLTVVLVGARNPQNIGAAARALQDFGFSDLRVVNQFAPPFEAAQLEVNQLEVNQLEANQLEANQLEARSAVGAGNVMRSARLFSSLPEAIADCTLVAGTTAIGDRGLRLPVQSLRDAGRSLLDHLSSATIWSSPLGTVPGIPGDLDSGSEEAAVPGQTLSSRPQAAGQSEETDLPLFEIPSSRPQRASGGGETPAFALGQSSKADNPPRVALLFGSEKTGLTNDQLSHCSLLLTIPLFAPEGRHLSMNLGQAVAVCLYELSREGFEGVRELPVLNSAPATSADRERLTALLHGIMESSGYARRFPANARPGVVRRLTAGLAGTREEAATWMGLFKLLAKPKAPDGP